MLPRVLTIAGTDPTGGAGLQADIKSISEAGGFPLSVATALVAQNTQGVREIHTPPLEFLTAQLDAVFDDVEVDAVKIGMLGSAEITRLVTDYLDCHPVPFLVVDPVMVATSGDRLLSVEAEDAVRELCKRATIITPNLSEQAVLVRAEEVRTHEEAIEQATALARDLGTAVLVKGGHLEGDRADNAVVYPTGEVFRIRNVRVNTTNTHGTGCSLSSCLATRLAVGQPLDKAAQWATLWLSTAIRHADDLHVGKGHGPVDHAAWNRMYREAASAAPWDLSPAPSEEKPLVAPAGPRTQALWSRCSSLLRAILGDGFLTMLADGTLPEHAFRFYLEQDALYLREYGKALAGVASHSPNSQDMIAWARDAQNTMTEEANLHREILGGETHAEPSYVTLGYTSLLGAAEGKDYVVAAATVLPCYWLYAEVALRMAEKNTPNHPYHAWLTAYADEGFIEDTRQAIERVERALEAAGEATREEATRNFMYAAYWEREFFNQALRAS